MEKQDSSTGQEHTSKSKGMPAPVKEFSLILALVVIVFIISYNQAGTDERITGYSALNTTANDSAENTATESTAANQTEETVVDNISTPPPSPAAPSA